MSAHVDDFDGFCAYCRLRNGAGRDESRCSAREAEDRRGRGDFRAECLRTLRQLIKSSPSTGPTVEVLRRALAELETAGVALPEKADWGAVALKSFRDWAQARWPSYRDDGVDPDMVALARKAFMAGWRRAKK